MGNQTPGIAPSDRGDEIAQKSFLHTNFAYLHYMEKGYSKYKTTWGLTFSAQSGLYLHQI